MGTVLYGARILLGDHLVEGLAVEIADDRIVGIVPEAEAVRGSGIELYGGILAPGFIDVQVNGGGGVLFNAEPTVDSLRRIGEAHRRFGTTGFLPTVITDDLSVLERAVRAVDQAIAEQIPGVLGIHIEGPMLAPDRRGIHEERYLTPATDDLLGIITSLKHGPTLVTLAPEVIEPKVIRDLVGKGVIVSAGHTEATFEQMQSGFDAGITGVTHLFNAMSPLTNRAPGAVGAALDNQNVWCGIIADGVHVHPATLRIAMRSRPVERFMAVTDAMSPVGTDIASFDLQGRRIKVEGDRCADEHQTLAGSVLTMERAVRNLVERVGIGTEEALQLASTSPATFIGLRERGVIAEGNLADLVWLDDQFNVRATWIGGRGWEGNLI